MQKGFQTVRVHSCGDGVIATPIIGENGNWWIGNEDTGISAKGEQGEIGPKGDKGEQGTVGPAGEKGEKGDKGEQGDIGAQGPQGIQGTQGIQGEQGATGEVDVAELERIDGEIAEINQSLNEIGAYVEIIRYPGGGNAQTFNIQGGLSQYKSICVLYNGEHTIIPTGLFLLNKSTLIQSNVGTPTGYHFTLHLSTEVETTITLSRNNTATLAIIYGIK